MSEEREVAVPKITVSTREGRIAERASKKSDERPPAVKGGQVVPEIISNDETSPLM